MFKLDKILLLFILITLLFITGCNGENKENNNEIELTKEEESELSKELKAHDDMQTRAIDNEPRWVVADGGLKLREDFNLESKEIMVIPDGEMVTITEELISEEEINGVTGHWTKIEYYRERGWVFGGYLSKEEPNKEGEIEETLLIGAWYKEEIDPSLGKSTTNFKIESNGVYKSYVAGIGVINGTWEFDQVTKVFKVTLDGYGSEKSIVISVDENKLIEKSISSGDTLEFDRINNNEEIDKMYKE